MANQFACQHIVYVFVVDDESCQIAESYFAKEADYVRLEGIDDLDLDRGFLAVVGLDGDGGGTNTLNGDGTDGTIPDADYVIDSDLTFTAVFVPENDVSYSLEPGKTIGIVGESGSGKSVCINTIIAGILYKAHPDEVKLILVDPKVVELSNYNGIPHLLVPVVTEPKKAASALHWAVAEMERRYKAFADNHVREIKSYNAQAVEKMPYIVIIIDELSDLMMVAKVDVEDAILRLAQKARAAGIHLILATQRPSVDVITGIVKANIPSRISFAVSSQTDSRTILDMGGAEKLLGKGDMLFYPIGYNKLWISMCSAGVSGSLPAVAFSLAYPKSRKGGVSSSYGSFVYYPAYCRFYPWRSHLLHRWHGLPQECCGTGDRQR